MNEQLQQNKGHIVTFSLLAVVILLLFQIAQMGQTLSGTVTAPKKETSHVEQSEEAPPLVMNQAYTVYQVAPGDSLYWIAAAYGLSVQELKLLNQMESDSIRVGQRLVVPMDQIRYYPAGVHLTTQEVEWLAQMIHAEARGEPYAGQVAVGAVILNRMLSPQFPDTLRGVLFQRNAFQPIQNGSFYMTPNESARKAALEALSGHDPTGGALFFFNPRQSTDRFMHSRPAKVTIGRHRFTM